MQLAAAAGKCRKRQTPGWLDMDW